MNTAAARTLEIESAYLAGVTANLKLVGSRQIAGNSFRREEHDAAEKVRAAMIDKRIYDRDRFQQLPHGRGFTVRGFEKRLFFWDRLRSVTVASVLAPPEPLLDEGATPPPVTLAQVQAKIRELVVDRKAPHLIGLCSPSGFEESALRAAAEQPNVTLVLIAPRDGGGWDVRAAGGKKIDERLLKLFDPEGVEQKMDRVRREIDARSIDLLTGGLSAESMARRLNLPSKLVEAVFEDEARKNPELRASRRAGDRLLFRGAGSYASQEDDSMSLAEWIRSLFSREGEEAKKINVLSERRAALSDRLNRMYDDIGKLEKREGEMIAEGQKASSQVVKRRVAAQIAHLRKDISRCNTSAAMLSKQINIISTHIHNLQLSEAGATAQLPTSEELTEAAVNAEEILESLNASADLVTGLEVGMAESVMSAEEADILKELEGPQTERESPSAAPATPDRAEAEAPTKQRERGPAQAE